MRQQFDEKTMKIEVLGYSRTYLTSGTYRVEFGSENIHFRNQATGCGCYENKLTIKRELRAGVIVMHDANE